ncbi:NAD(P)H-dependent oxidoreductase [Flavobacteriaceae bacterium F08102]|nr:NAD(P)H-dependent oxidoreductase [Flavobacteriaceae bacterium F08102]
MKKILAFAGSNSSTSINKQLVTYAANQLEESLTILDLNDFNLPVFGVDLEREEGIPQAAHDFLAEIKKSDGILLSLAEHNGAYSTVFKNLLDWMSRIDGALWSEIPMFLMATSPGKRGGASVLEIAQNRFKFMGGNIVSTFSLPSFNENFKQGAIINTDYKKLFKSALEVFKNSI